jgi:hypothetical protein
METPEVLAHRSVPQVAPGTYYFVLGVIAVVYAVAMLLLIRWAGPQISETGDEIHSFKTEAIRIVAGVGLGAIFPYLMARCTSRFESMMTPSRAEAALMKVHALELLRAGEFSRDDLRKIMWWLRKNDGDRTCEKKAQWRKRSDTPIEKFARILLNFQPWEYDTPSHAAEFPVEASGTFTVILQCSTDQTEWTAANPGDYSGSFTKRFFRTLIVKK